jgi:glucokinase
MFYAGIDLGGTNIAAGIVNIEGDIIIKDTLPTNSEREAGEIVHDMCLLIRQLMGKAGIDISELASVGIGSPGTPDRERGIIIYTNNLNFRNVPIRNLIQRDIPVPVYLENDANCAALAESIAGAGADVQSMVLITIGTGVGGGVIINRKLLTGFNGAASEPGHMVICFGGEPCTCGRRGCWEAYSAAPALIRQTRKAAMDDPHSKIWDLVQGDLDKISAKTAFIAARQDDETAKTVVERYIDVLADGLANIINIFQPDIVAIGGGVSKEGDNLLVPLREKVSGRTYNSKGVVNTRLVTAVLGNDAGIVGAALLSQT